MLPSRTGVIPAEDDNRASLLSLREEGMTAYEQALPHMGKSWEYLINSLTQEERETYFKLLSMLEGEVKDYEDEILSQWQDVCLFR